MPSLLWWSALLTSTELELSAWGLEVPVADGFVRGDSVAPVLSAASASTFDVDSEASGVRVAVGETDAGAADDGSELEVLAGALVGVVA